MLELQIGLSVHALQRLQSTLLDIPLQRSFSDSLDTHEFSGPLWRSSRLSIYPRTLITLRPNDGATIRFFQILLPMS